MRSIPKTTLFLIYSTVFINIVAFSLVFPLLPIYARMFDIGDVAIGALAASFALAQLLFSSFWGMVSDKYGRKPVILFGIFGAAISFLIFGLAGSALTLFLSRFFQGVFAAAAMPAARAYIADITTKDERVREMGRLGAALALGVILGPAIGGPLAEINPNLPFLGAGILALLHTVLIWKLLPESLVMKSEHPLALRESLFGAFTRLRFGFQSALMPLFVLSLLWSFALSNDQVIVPLLGIEKFNASAIDVALIFSVLGGITAFIQFFLLDKITAFFGDRMTIVLGMVLMAVGFLIMPFLEGTIMVLYFAIAVTAVGSAVTRPVITALISKETTEGQGITMGTANAFESLGRLIGPLLGGLLFSFGVSLPFIVSSIILLLVLALLVVATNFMRGHHVAATV